MAEEAPPAHDDAALAGHGEHDEIHLPPNSWVPINFSLSLMTTFVGFVLPEGARAIVVVAGVLWLVGTLVQWARAARNEFLGLP